MAGQDFAHNAAPSRKAADKPAQSTSILPAVAILFVAGACFAGGYWLGAGDIQQTGNKTDVDAVEARLAIKTAELKLQQARIENLESLVNQWKDKANQEAHTKVGELRFYKDLPRQSVMPVPVSATPAAKAAAKARIKPQLKAATHGTAISHATPHSSKQHMNPKVHKTQAVQAGQTDQNAYRIQIASFRQHSDAVPMQRQLEHAGFPAFIHSVDLADKGRWFRIYAGPFPSKTIAQAKMLQIEQQLHIKGFVLRGN